MSLTWNSARTVFLWYSQQYVTAWSFLSWLRHRSSLHMMYTIHSVCKCSFYWCLVAECRHYRQSMSLSLVSVQQLTPYVWFCASLQVALSFLCSVLHLAQNSVQFYFASFYIERKKVSYRICWCRAASLYNNMRFISWTVHVNTCCVPTTVYLSPCGIFGIVNPLILATAVVLHWSCTQYSQVFYTSRFLSEFSVLKLLWSAVNISFLLLLIK